MSKFIGLLNIIKHKIRKTFNHLGYEIVKFNNIDEVILHNKEFMEMYEKCRPYTLTSVERMYALYQAVKYIINAKTPGDFVECGVWKGGSAMIIALTLLKMGVKDRKIYLYDTFEGMSKPTNEDIRIDNKTFADTDWEKSQTETHNEWCFASIDEVRKNILLTEYPDKNLIFVKGKVEDTIPGTQSSEIALLRLDTDWYESTKHELIHLFPLLKNNGILIIDDYGHWAGSKKAVDEFFDNIPILLNRIDYTGRLAVKTK